MGDKPRKTTYSNDMDEIVDYAALMKALDCRP